MTVDGQRPGAGRHRAPNDPVQPGQAGQPGEQALPTDPAARLRAWLADRPFQHYAYAVGAVLLALTGIFGGLRTVDTTVAPLAGGRPVTAAPLTITITRTSWTTNLGPPGKAPAGQRFLTVAGTVRNDTATSVGSDVLGRAVHLQGVPDVYQDSFGDDVGASESASPWGIFVTQDSTRLAYVGPGLTYQAAWVFRQKDTQPAPTSVTVEVDGHTFRADTIDGTMKWLDPAAVATGTLPMKAAGS